MHILRLSAAGAAVLWLAAAPALAAGAFLAEFEDLPLAPGLTEQPGGVLFESPNGRIVEATAEGRVASHQVLAFYAQTLPQLGWVPVDETSYRRDNEILRIVVDGSRAPVSVHFSVAPH